MKEIYSSPLLTIKNASVKRKCLNKRSLSINMSSGKKKRLLIIDLIYFKKIYSSVRKYSSEKEFFCYFINKILSLSFPDRVILIQDKTSLVSELGLSSIIKELKLPIQTSTNLSAQFYTYKLNNIYSDYEWYFYSDKLSLWSLSDINNSISIIYSKGSKFYLFNNKTCLDILSRFIGTFKLINKLRLSVLKYVNLQYVYLLILYVHFLHKRKDNFQFSEEAYSNLYPTKDFSKSKGLGLEHITEAHKMLSYAFLTKPDMMDLFFRSNADHYHTNLNRLPKLLEMDKTILYGFKTFYSAYELHPFTYIPQLKQEPSLTKSMGNLFILKYPFMFRHLNIYKSSERVLNSVKKLDPSKLSTSKFISQRLKYKVEKADNIEQEKIEPTTDYIASDYIANLIQSFF